MPSFILYWKAWIALVVWGMAYACQDSERVWSRGKPAHMVICAIRVACGGIRVPFLHTTGWRLTAMEPGPTDGEDSMEKDALAAMTPDASARYTIAAASVACVSSQFSEMLAPVHFQRRILAKSF